MSAGRSASSSRDFEARIEEIVSAAQRPRTIRSAVGLANIPQKIRGFGHIKERNLAAAKAEEAALLTQFRRDKPALAVAAE